MAARCKIRKDCQVCIRCTDWKVRRVVFQYFRTVITNIQRSRLNHLCNLKNTIVIVFYHLVQAETSHFLLRFTQKAAACRRKGAKPFMTKTEMIHMEQEGGEWTTAVKRNQMLERYQRRKAKRQEKKRRLEERNEALRNMLNRKYNIE